MMELTKEFMQDIIKGRGFGVAPSAVEEMARQMLAGMEQEPVYQVLGDGSWTDCSKQQLEDLLESKPSTLFRVAYAAPQLPQPAVVPDEVIVFLNHLEDVLPDEAFNLIDVKTWNKCPCCRALRSTAPPCFRVPNL